MTQSQWPCRRKYDYHAAYFIDDMAWGAPRGVDDLIKKLKENSTARTLCILSTRKFGPSDVAAFSSALAENTSLVELLASGHPLGPTEAAYFGEALSKNAKLRSLCLGDNNFGDEGVRALVEGLRLNRGLLILDLDYKSISAGDALCTLLKTHPSLAELRLGRNQIGEPGAKDLSMGLRCSSTLLRLDLSGNKLDTSAVEAIGRALSCPSPSSTDLPKGGEGKVGPPPLEFLNVSSNPLGDEGGVALLHALSTGFGASRTLKGLAMADTGLGGGSATALATVLSPAPEGVSDADAAGDGGARPDGQPEGERRGLMQLRTLDLSKNKLGADGAAELAGALCRGGAPLLGTLMMGYNGVGDRGAAALGKAGRRELHVLDLSGNSLSGEGVKAVLSSPGLREARLFYNVCGDDGIPLVLEALRDGSVLETVDLGANGLTGAGFEQLLPELAAFPGLRTLELGANSNGERAEAAVRLSQSKNPTLDIAFRRAGQAMGGLEAAPTAPVEGPIDR